MFGMKIVVIGAGPGGSAAAMKAVEYGAEVTQIEQDFNSIGGTCLNRGCIPSKAFLDSAHKLHVLKTLSTITQDDAGELIAKLGNKFSWEKIQARRERIVTGLRENLTKYIKSQKINLVCGKASFKSDSEVEIETEKGTVTEKFDYAVIAVGNKIFYPKPFDSVRDKMLDSDKVFKLKKFPKSVTIVGGGVIGVEFACFFNAMGSNVEIVEISPSLLAGEDEMSARTLQNSFKKRGIKLHLSKTVESVSIEGECKVVKLNDGTEIKSDEIMVCAGRRFDPSELNLDKAGIKYDAKHIIVDKTMQTNVKNIYAVGDINGYYQLAHAAGEHGAIAMESIFGNKTDYNDDLIPRCVYSWPEVASVGINKKQATERGIKVKAYRVFMASSAKAITHDETEGFLQILADEETDKILGAQFVGLSATELIHIVSVAMKTKMTAGELSKVVFAHPTVAESIYEALDR
jgi:dihydrolipoyl dehydrogenase